MKTPRFDLDMDGSMEPHEHGRWVYYDDVQSLMRKTIQGLMEDPAFRQAMDEYYESKWAHRFD